MLSSLYEVLSQQRALAVVVKWNQNRNLNGNLNGNLIRKQDVTQNGKLNGNLDVTWMGMGAWMET